MTRIVAVVNQKGGVGKTTTAVNVAAALGRTGHRTLVIDLDPQGNASQALGIDRNDRAVSIYDVLLDGVDIDKVAIPTNELNVMCAPASVDLAGAEVELVGMDGRESRLADALTRYVQTAQETDPASAGLPEFILIDCPPSLGLLTLNALVSAQELFVPVQAEFYALDGVGQLIKTMELVRTALNPQLRISLVALTMVGPPTASQRYVTDEVRAFFGNRLAATTIPRDCEVNAAPSVGQTVLTFAPESAGAIAYTSLARDLVTAGQLVESI